MSMSRVFAGLGITTVTTVAGGAIAGGFNAACGAASGATGAAILRAAGHTAHSVHQATVMSATGNGILGGAVGTLTGLGAGVAISTGLFREWHSESGDKKRGKEHCLYAVAGYVAVQLIGALIGYAVMAKRINETESLGNYVADVAVGSAVTAIPISIGLFCAIGCLILAAVAFAMCATAALDACKSDAESSTAPRMTA